VRPAASTVEEYSTIISGAQIMSIDADGMNIILRTLSSMYSDPNLAVVREYASNALDSHIEAGNDGPILITSPSHFEPKLVVQDFGTGLSEEEVLNVFARYGASTKRETDEQVGSFGIGAKSAFAVGTQFYVTAVKNGWQTIALFALDKKGAPTVNIMSHREVYGEPDGVRVEISVRDVDGVKNAIDRLFPTWKRGSVLIDGVEPPCVWDDLDKLSDRSYVGFRTDRYNQDKAWTVVMGGVPYSIPSAVTASLSSRTRQIIYNVQQSMLKVYSIVPIGTVDITPSREDLMVTEKTTEAITGIAEEFHRQIGPWISKQIEQEDSLGAALIAYGKLRSKLGSTGRDVLSHVTWHGKPLPSVPAPLPAAWFNLQSRGYYGNHNARKTVGLPLSPSDHLNRYLFVTSVPEKRVRSVQLAAKPYLINQDRQTGHGFVVALTGSPSDYVIDWFDPADPAYATMDFDTFIAQWKPKPTPAQRGEVRYQVHGDDDPATVAELNTMGTVYYLNWGERDYRLRNNPLLDLTVNGQPVVILSATQKMEVFLKRVPNAVYLRQALQDKGNEILDNLQQGDHAALFCKSVIMSADSALLHWLNQHQSKITNTVVNEALSLYQVAVAAQQSTMDRMSLLRLAAECAHRPMPVSVPDGKKLEVFRKVASGLPLLYAYMRSSRYGDSEPLAETHVIDYINSIKL
jgi:hypothetical protein